MQPKIFNQIGRGKKKKVNFLTTVSLLFISGLVLFSLTHCGGGGGGGSSSTSEGPINPALFSGWEMTNGPFSGSISSFIIDPIDSGVVYSVTRKSAVYKSTDGGFSWTSFPTIDSITQENIWAQELAIAPTANRVFYLGTGSQGMYKSEDGGETWVHISSGLPETQYGYLDVDDILIDPADSNIIYVRLDMGYRIYKTVDAGQNWSEIYNGASSLNPAIDMAIDPTNTILYIGLWYEGVWKSTDGGLNWTPKNNGLPQDLEGNITITEVAIDHQSPLRVYVGTFDYGLYGTGNGGESWVPLEIFPGTDQQEILSLEVDPNDGLKIYVGMNDRDDSSKDGLWVTNDGGMNWIQYFPDTWVGLIRIASSDSTVFVDGDDGMYKRSGPTEPWEQVNFDMIADIRVNAFPNILPLNTDFIYAGTELGVYKTTNGGSIWEPKSQGLGDEYVYALVMDPNDNQTVYVGTFDGVYLTTDGGENWVQKNTGLANHNVYALAMDPTNSNVIYAGTARGIFKTPDGGENWVERSDGLPFTYNSVWCLAVAPNDNLALYASVIDVFGTWEEKICKSTNGGTSWVDVSGQLPSDRTIRGIAISAIDNNVVYVGVEGYGVYKTVNGGGTWELKNSGLTSTNVTSLAISQGDDKIVYAGTSDEGVFATIDGGDNWVQIDEGLTCDLNRCINSIAIAANDDLGYAGTGCGVFRAYQ
jgi:photosystem II stability/assembly factor-like uncharacterized protein